MARPSKEEREDLGVFWKKNLPPSVDLASAWKSSGSQMWTLKKLKTEIENNWSETAGETVF